MEAMDKTQEVLERMTATQIEAAKERYFAGLVRRNLLEDIAASRNARGVGIHDNMKAAASIGAAPAAITAFFIGSENIACGGKPDVIRAVREARTATQH